MGDCDYVWSSFLITESIKGCMPNEGHLVLCMFFVVAIASEAHFFMAC